MEIIFVGTGSGQTSVNRYHSSFLIKTSRHNLLIDAGDGISKAILKINLDYNLIDSVLFTHYHADHFSGIASLITQMKLTNRTKPLRIYTHKNLITPLESLLNSVYMFKEILGFDLTIEVFDFDKIVCINNDISFIGKKNSHIRQKENLKHYPAEHFVSLSFLFKVEAKNICYTSDVGSKNDLYLFKDQNIDYFISECTHIRSENIYEAFQRINPKKFFITHIDDEKEMMLEKWYGNLKEDEKKKIIVCTDGLTFSLNN